MPKNQKGCSFLGTAFLKILNSWPIASFLYKKFLHSKDW